MQERTADTKFATAMPASLLVSRKKYVNRRVDAALKNEILEKAK